MIVKEFNQGWGDNFELRKFEKSLLFRYLQDWYQDDKSTIIVNSTWYNQDLHCKVLAYCTQHKIERIVLTSLVDPYIVEPSWFTGIEAEIRCAGYYPGVDDIDAWAMIMDQYFLQQEVDICTEQFDQHFLCYNRKPHWHRKKLFNAIRTLGDHGMLTMGAYDNEPVRGLINDDMSSDIAPNPGKEPWGIPNDIMSLGPMAAWNRCFLVLVTETVFDVDKQWFHSEKIYKPILGLRPFLVYAPNGASSMLRHRGIESYHRDFLDISDHDPAQPDQLPLFMQDLCQQPLEYLEKKFNDLLPKMQHNHQQFYNHVTQQKNKIDRGITAAALDCFPVDPVP